jgi:hypothetical protein
MNMEELRRCLLWCIVLNYGVLAIWFGVFTLAHDRLFELHHRWFALSVAQFDLLHYAGMTVYKVGVLLFNLVPWIAFRAALRRREPG